MALDRTWFNNLVDDDGSNAVGTVWNKAQINALLNSIDAFVGSATAWTPSDASGAGLVLVNNGCRYARIGNVVLIAGAMTYPATANGLLARPGGLPVTSSAALTGGLYSSRGHYHFNLQPSSTALYVQNPASAINLTNADLSGALLLFSGLYFV